MTDPWPERPIYQQLGANMKHASRAEVLAELRNGMARSIIVDLEGPDGTSLLRIMARSQRHRADLRRTQRNSRSRPRRLRHLARVWSRTLEMRRGA
jgi:hypothetical protein